MMCLVYGSPSCLIKIQFNMLGKLCVLFMVHHHVICVFKKFMFVHVVLCQFFFLVMNAHVCVHICVTVHISNLYSQIN